MNTIFKGIFILGISLSVSGCEKYLNEKSDRKLVVPSSLNDLQSILDNSSTNMFNDPGDGEVSSTDYYLTDEAFNALSSDGYKRMYTWEPNYLFEPSANSWSYCYKAVYAANSVLEGLSKINRTNFNQDEWDNIKGQALYIRGRSFQQLAFIFTLAYDENTSGNDLGIPLRLSTDFNVSSVRNTNAETYLQIKTDLTDAIPLLSLKPKHVVRASKPAAFALLARTYLSMRKYEAVAKYADSCLQIFNTIIDYNELDGSLSIPIKQFNKETIIFSAIGTPAPISQSRARVIPELYAQYDDADLRKTIFFKENGDGSIGFKGSYTGNVSPFGGISTDEVYLMRAEGNIRNGNIKSGIADINFLLSNRYKKTENQSAFVPFPNNITSSEAIDLVLRERRKELLMRGLRWMDVKRLNKEGQNITLTRFVNGQNYILPPNDLRYALPIPEDIVELSGIEQNAR